MYKYIYGPVPSRRLGISLGIDLIPYKVCSLNCVYCECGRTDKLTMERKEYHPITPILAELFDFLDNNPMPDWLTLSGSGEPTLNSCMGKLIKEVKSKYPDSRFAVLTNSTTLCDPEIRRELMEADLIIPSLDAATAESYFKIDRPVKMLCGSDKPDEVMDRLIEGLIDFREELKRKDSSKQIWLEVFIIDGINTDRQNINAFRNAFLKINPDKIQLNTLDRPGSEAWVNPASREQLEKVKHDLKLDNVEIISRYKHRNDIPNYHRDTEEAILEILDRRPSTLQDLEEILSDSPARIESYLDILKKEKRITVEIEDRGIFYKGVHKEN